MKTVKQLIEELKKMPQDLPVLLNDNEWGYFGVGEPGIATNVEIVKHFTNKPSVKIKKAVVL